MSYNGWENHATWALKLHIDNNEGDYQCWVDETKRILEESKTPRADLMERLKEWYEEIKHNVIYEPDSANKEARLMVDDVGNGSDVNYYEIAQALIEESK